MRAKIVLKSTYHPLAYDVVEAENTSSWKWFLTCLGDDLGLQSMSNFTFISDRQKGIFHTNAAVFPNAEHRYCIRHIYQNMKREWSDKRFKDHLWRCASASNNPLFERCMESLREFNHNAYEWLKEIPPKYWFRAYFTGRSHSDVLLNNFCEVFNRQVVDARVKIIITCLEYIREYLMKRIVNVQKLSMKSNGPLKPNVQELFESIKVEDNGYNILWNGLNEYQVRGPWMDQCVVDMEKRACSCGKWELASKILD